MNGLMYKKAALKDTNETFVDTSKPYPRRVLEYRTKAFNSSCNLRLHIIPIDTREQSERSYLMDWYA